MRRLVLIAVFAPFSMIARADDVPKGEVAKYSFNASKIFPGTVRDYWVYVPKQYDPAKPACLYVNQDGIQFKAPEVFDKLIAAKEMPVTIGVFVMHGRVPALTPNALDRFNRSYEYDGLGDNYVRFLLEELLPEVEKKTTADGRVIKLSKAGNDRAIGGSSSGAICAFTAAWERPDSFRRVFSAIGTYVGLRGGNNYPTLIRKTEPKPIRVFLQDGSNDHNIYAGDWWMANQEMERALKFAGYEVEHAWDEGEHNNDGGTRVFPDAMRWLWKDWPTPVKAGLGSPQMREILVAGAGWTLVSDAYRKCLKLTNNAKGEVVFSDNATRKAYRIALDGRIEAHFESRTYTLPTGFAANGEIIGIDSDKNEIVSLDASGQRTVRLHQVAAQEAAIRHDGQLYVIGFDLSRNDKGKGIWHITPDGAKKMVTAKAMDPMGLAFSADQSLLFVTDYLSHWAYCFQLQVDGEPKFEQQFCDLHMPETVDYGDAHRMIVDRDGRLYIATRMGIQVCDQLGRVNCILTTPNGMVTGLCFGGEKFDTLFVACGDKIYKRKVKVQGANAFEPPIKPKKPGL